MSRSSTPREPVAASAATVLGLAGCRPAPLVAALGDTARPAAACVAGWFAVGAALGLLGVCASQPPASLSVHAAKGAVAGAGVAWIAATVPALAWQARHRPGRGRQVALAGLVLAAVVAVFAGHPAPAVAVAAIVAVGLALPVVVIALGTLTLDVVAPAARARVLAAGYAVGLTGVATGVATSLVRGSGHGTAVLVLAVAVAAATAPAATVLDPDGAPEDLERLRADAGTPDLDDSGPLPWRRAIDVGTRSSTQRLTTAGHAAAGAYVALAVLLVVERRPHSVVAPRTGAWLVALAAAVAAVLVLAVAVVLDRIRNDPGRWSKRWLAASEVATVGLVAAVFGSWPPVCVAGAAVGLAAAVVLLALLATTSVSVVPVRGRPSAWALSTAATVTGALLAGGVLAQLRHRYGPVSVVPGITTVTGARVVGLLVLRARRHVEADVKAFVDAATRPPARLARPDAVLTAQGVDVAYGPVQVLFGVDLVVGAGEVVGLLGANGVGKTTLLRVLAGLERPAAGTVTVLGTDMAGVPAHERVALGLTSVFGDRPAFPSLTVTENLRMHAFVHKGNRELAGASVDAAFAVFPRLAERRHQRASTLSGGEKQMLALAKTLVQRPRLLIVDEFSLGLAPVVVAGLLELVRRLNAVGTAVLLVEQSAHVALSVVDRAYFMDKGEIVGEASAEELRRDPERVAALLLGGAAAAVAIPEQPVVIAVAEPLWGLA